MERLWKVVTVALVLAVPALLAYLLILDASKP